MYDSILKKPVQFSSPHSLFGVMSSGIQATTTTWEDNFSTDQWIDTNSSKMGVAGGVLAIADWKRAGATTSFATYRDPTGAAFSDTAWVLRYIINHVTLTNNNQYLFVGMSDTTFTGTNPNNDARDFIGTFTAHGSTQEWIRGMDTDEIAIQASGGDDTGTVTWATGTDYYTELTRTTATAYTIEVDTVNYEDTFFDDASGVCASTTDALRFVGVVNNAFSTQTDVKDSDIDNMEFWDGVTAPP